MIPDFRALIDLVSAPPRPSLLSEYLQQHVYGQLLNENARLDYVAKTYGAKLQAKWDASKTAEPSMVQAGVEQMKGDTELQKLINYFSTLDPTPHKEFTQWLVIRYLRDEFRLEDGTTAHDEVLPDFITMRQRLPPDRRDINKYRGLGEVRAALHTTQEQDIPAADPVLDAKMHKQAKVIYNGPDVKIIVPETPTASCYFGKSTEWCTAKYGPTDHRNLHNNYTKRGPLYIIYDKKTGKRVQFHFQTGQFMDEMDSPIRLGDYLRQHPTVFRVLGEENFITYADQIGLSWFRPDVVAKFPMNQLARMVHSPRDLQRVPLDVQNTVEFLRTFLRTKPQGIQWLQRDQYAGHLEALVEYVPELFRNLQPDLQNADLAEIAAANSHGWQLIEQNVPEEWRTPEVNQLIWNSRIHSDTQLHLKDVPAEYHSENVIAATLVRYPGEIPNHLDEITSEIAHQIASEKVDAIQYLPDEFLDREMVDIIQKTTRHQPDTYQQRGYRFMLRFPSSLWTEDAVKYLVQGNQHFDFTRIPEQFRTKNNLETYLKSHAETANSVPVSYLTHDVLVDVLATGVGRKLLSHLGANLLTGAVLNDVAPRLGYYTDTFYSEMPEALRQPEVRRIFMRVHAVPVDEMPPGDMTEEALIARIGNHVKETADVPQAFWTPDFAVKLVERTIDTIPGIPDAMLSEPLLWAFLSQRPDDDDTHVQKLAKQQVKRFPPQLWSSRTYAAAIAHQIIPAKLGNVPPDLLDSEVVGEIIRYKPSEIPNVPERLINDESLSLAVSKNAEVIPHMPLERITEPVAFEAMRRWAPMANKDNHQGYYADKFIKLLQRIPREVWSKRVYAEAAGNLVSLKDVPRAFRDVEMIANAIMRDPSNVQYVSNPAKFCTAHVKQPDNKKHGTHWTEKWKAKLESFGIVPLKNGSYAEIKGLPRVALPSGYQVAILSLGRVNARYYLFSPRGTYICYLYTDKQKVWFPDAKNYQKYQQPLIEIAREYLSGFEAWELNNAGVYNSYSNWFSEAKASRTVHGALQWSKVDHLSGKMYVAWFRNKPILRAYVDRSNAMFGKGTDRIYDFKIHDMPVAVAHAADILRYASKTMHQATDHRWQSLGIISPGRTGNVYNVGEVPIGKVGDYSVKRTAEGSRNYVGIFGPKGMIAYGLLRRNGTIERQEHYRSNFTVDAIDRAFDSIARYLTTGAQMQFKMPATKDDD